MKIFTISEGRVSEGATVEVLKLSTAEVEIPAILVGEKGRGRKLGVLPVHLLPEKYKEWQDKGEVTISAAKVGQTKAGKPKLIETSGITDTEKCICVFRTRIGYRGANEHTGDRDGGMERDYWDAEYPTFHPFPGEILCEGIIAQGDAGMMGSGSQLVAVMPAGTVFRTAYYGRLYGEPSAHYYVYRDGQLLSATWDEREVSDIF
ncbi:MAG TPA: hypothetical protein GXX64_10875 [Bacteroidales bacterium]|nr:hypothetical protein [Bacteroidales bacterium]